MNDSPSFYEKQNSFLEIRKTTSKTAQTIERLQRLHSRLDQSGLTGHKKDIVTKAFDDACDTTFPHDSRFVLQDYVSEEIARIPDDLIPRYLFYRYRYEMFPQLRQLDDFPPCLQVEPASICNYRCVFCYQTDPGLTHPSHGHMGLMSLDLFKQVIDQAQGNCEAVTLASRGEPLMNKQIEEMLAYCAGKFLGLKVNTNAWFLEERKCHALLQADLNTLVFSADAAVEPLYSQMRVGGKLEVVLANIRRFQEIRSRHYPKSRTITRLSGVKFSDAQSLDDMGKVWGDLVDEVAFVKYNPWENTYERPVNEITTSCSDLWRRMFVWWDGRVNPCDVDCRSTLAVGRLQEESLSQLWTGKKYAALRQHHLSGNRRCASPCDRCTVV